MPGKWLERSKASGSHNSIASGSCIFTTATPTLRSILLSGLLAHTLILGFYNVPFHTSRSVLGGSHVSMGICTCLKVFSALDHCVETQPCDQRADHWGLPQFRFCCKNHFSTLWGRSSKIVTFCLEKKHLKETQCIFSYFLHLVSQSFLLYSHKPSF